MPNHSKYDSEIILNTLIDMRVNKCMSTKSILDFLQNELGYSQAQAYVHLQKANQEICTIWSEQNRTSVEGSIAQMEEMLEYAKVNKNLKLWMELRKEMNKKLGFNDSNIDITTKGEKLEGFVFNVINTRKKNED